MLQDYRLRSWGTHLHQHTSTTMKGATFNIDQWVDLNTYTNNKGWKGCCYRNRSFSIYRTNKIVSIFIVHFGEHLHRAVIVSNLFRIKEQRLPNSNIGHYVKYIEKYLINFGYLKLESNAIYNHANCLTTGFKTFQQPGADIVAMFSLLVVMHDAIDGHCFFVFEDLSLIAYPHDDTGFGLIRMHDSKLQPEGIFLQHVQQLPHFTSSYASTD